MAIIFSTGFSYGSALTVKRLQATHIYTEDGAWELPSSIQLDPLQLDVTFTNYRLAITTSLHKGKSVNITNTEDSYYANITYSGSRLVLQSNVPAPYQCTVVAGNMITTDSPQYDDVAIGLKDEWYQFPYTLDSNSQKYIIPMDNHLARLQPPAHLLSHYWMPLCIYAVVTGPGMSNITAFWSFTRHQYVDARGTAQYSIDWANLQIKQEWTTTDYAVNSTVYGSHWIAICPHESLAPNKLLLVGGHGLKDKNVSQLYTINHNYHISNHLISTYAQAIFSGTGVANGLKLDQDHYSVEGFSEGPTFGSAKCSALPTTEGFSILSPYWTTPALEYEVLSSNYTSVLADDTQIYVHASDRAPYVQYKNLCPMYLHNYSSEGKLVWDTTSSSNPTETTSLGSTYITKEYIVGGNSELLMAYAYNSTENILSFCSHLPDVQNAVRAGLSNTRVLYINDIRYAIAFNTGDTWNTQTSALSSTPFTLKKYGLTLESQNVGQRSFVKVNGVMLQDSSDQSVYTDQTIIDGEHYHTA